MFSTNPEETDALAEAAVLWGYPLVQTGRYLQLAFSRGIAFNQFYLNPHLATPNLKVGSPNVDTIYGFAWLELSKEPVVLDVPDTHDRYYSIQFTDAYENTFAYVGQRETGTQAGTFVVAASGWSGQIPHGLRTIAAPTTVVLAFARTLVRGEHDASAAAALQQHYTLCPLSSWPSGVRKGIVKKNASELLPTLDFSGVGARFFDELDRLVRTYPPTGAEADSYIRIARLGIGTSDFQLRRPPDAVLNSAVERAITRIKAIDRFPQSVNGWKVNYHIRRFTTDPAERAALNLHGPLMHIAEEALYFLAVTDLDGQPLSGLNSYRVTFPIGQLPPVDGFWSLNVYDENYLLVDNPLNRYAITDRTVNLENDADGSLTVSIQHMLPKHESNWLPAPRGHFWLIFRMCLPRQPLLEGSYVPPPLERVL